jgi:hypothetical protein
MIIKNKSEIAKTEDNTSAFKRLTKNKPPTSKICITENKEKAFKISLKALV